MHGETRYTCAQRLSPKMSFLLYILVFCVTILLFLFALLESADAAPFIGAGVAIVMLLTCRCSYTGLLCHLYTNSEPFLTMMRPTPTPTDIPDALSPPTAEEQTMEEISDSPV